MSPAARVKIGGAWVPAAGSMYAKISGAFVELGDVPGSGLSDSFDRADSTTTLGNADTGQTWSPVSGTWGINGNKAYLPSPANGNAAWIDAGISDCTFICDLTYINDGDGVLFRGLGSTNSDGWLCYLASASLQVLRPGFGSALANVSLGHSPGVTYQLKIVLLGSSIKVYENDILRVDQPDATQQTATRFGMRSGGVTVTKRWDNFSVVA